MLKHILLKKYKDSESLFSLEFSIYFVPLLRDGSIDVLKFLGFHYREQLI